MIFKQAAVYQGKKTIILFVLFIKLGGWAVEIRKSVENQTNLPGGFAWFSDLESLRTIDNQSIVRSLGYELLVL